MIAVAEHLHFGRAARAINVSQPTLSGQIRKVEEILDIEIFQRDRRAVSVTSIGELIVSQAKVVLSEARKIAAIAAPSAAVNLAPIKIGAIATLGPYYLPRMLGPLQIQFPEYRFLWREGTTEQLLADVRAGRLDAALVSPPFPDAKLDVTSLFYEPFLLAAPRGHELLAKPELLARDLRAGEMVLLEDEHCLRGQTLNICPLNRRGQINEYHATSINTLLHLVASGWGYTLIPKLAVPTDANFKPKLGFREFSGRPIGRDVAFASRKSRHPDERLARIATFLRERRPADLVIKGGKTRLSRDAGKPSLTAKERSR